MRYLGQSLFIIQTKGVGIITLINSKSTKKLDYYPEFHVKSNLPLLDNNSNHCVIDKMTNATESWNKTASEGDGVIKSDAPLCVPCRRISWNGAMSIFDKNVDWKMRHRIWLE